MARVFYYSDTGTIYGVHHSPHESNPKIRLPDGVAWIDVPEPPDKIPWPSTSDGRPGNEHWCRINPDTKRIEIEKSKVPPPPPSDDLRARLSALKGKGASVDQIIDALIGNLPDQKVAVSAERK